MPYGIMSFQPCVTFDPAEDETDPNIECLGDSYPFGFTIQFRITSICTTYMAKHNGTTISLENVVRGFVHFPLRNVRDREDHLVSHRY